MDKLANGKMEIKSEPIDLVPLVHHAIEVNSTYASHLGVSLVAEIAPALHQAWCLGDADRLMQVMANLLSNAAKFSPEGERVIVRLSQADEVYRIAVCDHGTGIPFEFQTHLFEPFTQADSTNTRRQGGTGLGLSITKTLIEKMRGEIFFDSCPDKGTTFWFHLPIHAMNHAAH